ncbi:uncharacterized protein LOC106638156 [Copidosoma floridanum]|uniref:uncharacterized protein LOC106638156 n=1 Tax=Copidosoma floridanum TaxID=29053 RepID=UPI0006C95C9F|nr:uncharacterized protein LOC106638156 [Copidosoma floridanum]
MRIFALAVLLVVICVVQNTTAVTPDWQYRTKLSHWSSVSAISDRTFGYIRKIGKTNCSKKANSDLRSMTEAARIGIWNCVDASTSEAEGIACAKAEVVKASARADEILRKAKYCAQRY